MTEQLKPVKQFNVIMPCATCFRCKCDHCDGSTIYSLPVVPAPEVWRWAVYSPAQGWLFRGILPINWSDYLSGRNAMPKDVAEALLETCLATDARIVRVGLVPMEVK